MRLWTYIGLVVCVTALSCDKEKTQSVERLRGYIQQDNVEFLQKGLSRDSVNIITKDSVSLLTLAVRNASESAIDILIAKGADVNLRNKNALSSTPLMEVSALENPLIAKKLIEAGADVNLQDKKGDTALNWGCYKGNNAFASVLLKSGADPFIKSSRADHAILAAQQTWNQHTVTLFIQERKGLQAVTAMQDALLKSIEEDNLSNFYLYVDSTNLDLTNEAGTTLLGVAAAYGVDLVAQKLIAWGATVDSMNPSGQTPIARAARFGHLDIVAMLIKAGADVNKSNRRYNMTPLMASAIGGHLDIGQLLIEKGANLEEQDGILGLTALEWAREKGKTECVKMLIRNGANDVHAGRNRVTK